MFVVAALTGQSALIASDHDGRPGVAAALRDHAQGLASVSRFVGHSQTMREGDNRPEAQAFELRRYMRSLSGGADADHAPDAFAAGLKDVVESLADCARRQNDHSRWLLPALRPGPAMWQPSAVGSGPAPFVERIESVAAYVVDDPRLPPPRPAPALLHALSAVPPRTSVGRVVRTADEALDRPPNPAQPAPARRRG